jgi:hypothetical protein
VYDGGGIPLLIGLLEYPNDNVQTNVVWALINLTNNGTCPLVVVAVVVVVVVVAAKRVTTHDCS